MKQDNFYRRAARRLVRALILLGMISTVACSSDVNFSPTQPNWPDADWQPGAPGLRLLEISGDLVAEQGACFEATVLFDGVEVEGARTVCSRSEGCTKLKMKANVESAVGRHTISFQVLDQSAAAIEYSGQGTVLISRENLELWNGPLILSVPLPLTRATLSPGDSMAFDLKFTD